MTLPEGRAPLTWQDMPFADKPKGHPSTERLEIEKLQARVAELEAKIDQMHGLADEGCTAPNAAYRWCERIDEVATHGAQEEYAQYAMSSKRAARPPEATTDPL